MFSSIQTALSNPAAKAETVLVLPADMPFVNARTVRRLIAVSDGEGRVIVPSYGGRRGHPIVIPGRLRQALLDADPRGSLRNALGQLGVETMFLDVDDEGIVRDVDVPSDLGPSTSTALKPS